MTIARERMNTDFLLAEASADGDVSNFRILKELSAAASAQSKLSNRIWFGQITLALFALIPKTQAVETVTTATLPWLGAVDLHWFYPIIFGMLVAFMLAGSVAHTQLLRAQNLAHSYLKKLYLERGAGGDGSIYRFAGIPARELYDVMTVTSIIRVGPIAQAVREPNQSYSEGKECTWSRRFLSVCIYVLLKIVSNLVYFGMPLIALWLIHTKVGASTSGILLWALYLAGIVAGLTFFYVFVGDLMYSRKVLGKLWSKE